VKFVLGKKVSGTLALGIFVFGKSVLGKMYNPLNSCHPKIKFTLEVGGRSINFLDPRIALNEK